MDEVRLIDAEKLKTDLKQYFSDGTLESVSAKLAFNMILRKFDDAPTVNDCPKCEYKKQYDYFSSSSSYKELQSLRKFKKDNERPHGEWIRKRNEQNVDICCTNCGYDDGYSCFKYCPNCGANMRPEKKIQTPSCLTNPERQAELLERYKEE